MRNDNENCSNCIHCESQRISETSIERVLICLESPPDTIAMGTPQGPVFIPAKRIVGTDVWCSKYRPLQPTEKLVVS